MAENFNRRELLEMALRPLGALGTAAEFPQDREGIEALIGRLPEGRQTEPRRFVYEEAGALPTYERELTTWLSPAGDGALRVRREEPGRLRSDAIVLRPDGRFSGFESIEGFGVPEAELTDRARAELAAHEERTRERAEEAPRQEERIKEAQERFRPRNLIRTIAAPPGQHPDGPVAAFVALYEGGVLIDFFVPRPAPEALRTDDPFAEPLFAAMFPRLELDDGLGTEYRAVDLASLDATGSSLRSRVSFAPGVPEGATTLRVGFDEVTVVIDLGLA